MVTVHKHSFALTTTGVGLVSFAATILMLSAAYVRDLTLLTDAPIILWSALCGRPGSDPLTLPILVMMSLFALLTGTGMILVSLIYARKAKNKH